MVSPKNSFLDWDTTASNNTDIGGVGILGTNAVSNFDDAFRTAMAQLRSGVDGKVVYATKSGSYTAVANDNNAVIRFTAAATLSLTAAATLGANWHLLSVIADGADVTIDPNASETINGQLTLVIPNGMSAQIICDGASFYTGVKPAAWESIGVYTPSAAASVAITNLGAFRFLRATGLLVPSSANAIAWRSSTNNGVGYDSGASDYTRQTLAGNGASAGANGTTGNSGLITLANNSGCGFEFNLFNFNQAAFLLSSSKNYALVSGGANSEVVGSSRDQSTARNALQIFAFGGATISGKLHLEGIRG